VDPDAKALALIQAMSNDAVKVQGEQVLIVADDGTATDAVTGAVVPLSDQAEDAMVNNRMRGALEAAAALRDVFGSDVERQREAAALLQRSAFQEPDAAALPVLEKALAGQLDDQARASLEQARAAMQLASEDEAQRLAAAQTLAGMGQRALRPLLLQQLEAETSAAVKAELQAALAALDRKLAVASGLSQAFTGISLGSILLLAALGLAITYGLMGVINMAHGELIMIGAYATWLVQTFFKEAFPGLFDWYLLAALPVAFITAALVGAAMERTVIRFLFQAICVLLIFVYLVWGVQILWGL
jgi:urea transport system permease protein